MRKLGILLVLGLVAVVSAVQTPAQSAVPVTLIKAGRLLDPCTGNILAPAALLIEGDKIKQVGSASHDAGMPPVEILSAVATNAAEMLGWRRPGRGLWRSPR